MQARIDLLNLKTEYCQQFLTLFLKRLDAHPQIDMSEDLLVHLLKANLQIQEDMFFQSFEIVWCGILKGGSTNLLEVESKLFCDL